MSTCCVPRAAQPIPCGQRAERYDPAGNIGPVYGPRRPMYGPIRPMYGPKGPVYGPPSNINTLPFNVRAYIHAQKVHKC